MRADSGANTTPPESLLSEDEDNSPIDSHSRDSEYYFDDGSIIFCMENTLFKVHASILRLRPSDFEGRFDASPECVNSTRGTSDETPIVIPNIKASQFRNLMKVIYCPPSDKFFLSLPAATSADIEEGDAWTKFIFYLDVACLAHRFRMHDIEKWAKPRLKSLVHIAAQKICNGIDSATSDGSLGLGFTTGVEGGDSSNAEDDHTDYGTYEEDKGDMEESNCDEKADCEGTKGEGDAEGQVDENNGGDDESDDSDSDSDYTDSEEDDTEDESENDSADENDEHDSSDYIIRAEDSAIFRFIDGIWYAKEILDTPLLHDMQNILQCYCSRLRFFQPEVELLLSFFRFPYLCEKDPSIFGYLFLLLLELGHKTWNRKIFTHMDRMAFFSAQCYLTPLPDSLKIPAATPFFNKPESAKKFARRFSTNLTQTSCAQKCYQEALSSWQTEFDDEYYNGVASSEPLVAIENLTTIPYRRLCFSEKLRGIECSHRCYLRLLGRVDRDIQGLYARLAEYYKPIA
ncbi:hypothetical protein B0J17DRAFT_672740 [Rhizoctonia solani]|nr:hypothetical protein B0J17DRAFT_672740 [Rhizoctonia solani]